MLLEDKLTLIEDQKKRLSLILTRFSTGLYFKYYSNVCYGGFCKLQDRKEYQRRPQEGAG